MKVFVRALRAKLNYRAAEGCNGNWFDPWHHYAEL